MGSVPSKRCYWVGGPESHGNRFLASILVRAGCIGVAGHAQKPLEKFPIHETPAVIVRNAIDEDRYQLLESRGYEVITLIVARHPLAGIGSMVRWRHADRASAAAQRIRDCYKGAIAAAKGTWYVVPYEALCGPDHEAAAEGLLKLIGLPLIMGPTVTVDGILRTPTNQNWRHLHGDVLLPHYKPQ